MGTHPSAPFLGGDKMEEMKSTNVTFLWGVENLNVPAESPATIRIVIIDNHTLVRAGLCSILENQPDLKVVGQTGSLDEAIRLVASTQPDIILLEQDPEIGLGVNMFSELVNACSQARIILVTGSNNRQTYLQAVQFGALGVVLKTQPPDILMKAIRKVHLGELWIDHSLVANLVAVAVNGQANAAENPKAASLIQFSEREREIIEFIGLGLPNKQIANQLCISNGTVRHYLTAIYRKVGVKDRLELLVYAQSHNLTQHS